MDDFVHFQPRQLAREGRNKLTGRHGDRQSRKSWDAVGRDGKIAACLIVSIYFPRVVYMNMIYMIEYIYIYSACLCATICMIFFTGKSMLVDFKWYVGVQPPRTSPRHPTVGLGEDRQRFHVVMFVHELGGVHVDVFQNQSRRFIDMINMI